MKSPAIKLLSLLLFLAAVVSISRQFSSARYGPGFETLNVAKTLAESGTFGNPYEALQTGPTAHCAPLYPMFLALLIRIFDYSALFALATSACAILVHAIHVMLLPYVSMLFFNRIGPGIWGALMTIFLPLYYFLPEFEIIYDAAGLMVFCLASASFARAPGLWRAIGVGVLLGMLVLLNPANLSVAVLWLIFLAWRNPNRRLWKPMSGILAVAVLVISPWTVRNYLQFHRLVPVRDNLGVELYIANNDDAGASFAQNMPSFMRRHPAAAIDEARAVVDMGEAAYSESRRALATNWMKTHPRRFFELFTTRARMFWFSDSSDNPAHARAIVFATIASFLGLALLAFRRQPLAAFFAAVGLIYPLIYYCVQHDPRYRIPILWLTVLAAGYLASALWDRTAASAKLEKLWQFRM